uniref:Uncharacterized protein n=1 Tax=Hyaloperonospora arabidopsidis (strain Emoy2) TaxID=559515 RepID=M4BMH5_HYAAE
MLVRSWICASHDHQITISIPQLQSRHVRSSCKAFSKILLLNTKRLVARNDKATIGEHTIMSRSSSACSLWVVYVLVLVHKPLVSLVCSVAGSSQFSAYAGYHASIPAGTSLGPQTFYQIICTALFPRIAAGIVEASFVCQHHDNITFFGRASHACVKHD